MLMSEDIFAVVVFALAASILSVSPLSFSGSIAAQSLSSVESLRGVVLFSGIREKTKNPA